MQNEGMNDSDTIEFFIEKANKEGNNNPEKSLTWARQAMLRSRFGKFRLLELQSTLLAATSLNSMTKYNEAVGIIEECVFRFSQQQLTGDEAILYSNVLSVLAFSYFSIAQYTESINTLNKVLDLIKSASLPDRYYMRCIMHLGITYTYIDKYLVARNYLIEALTLSKNHCWDEEVNIININLGENYFRSGELEQAYIYYTEALGYFKNNHNDKCCIVLTSLGAIKLQQGKYQEAEEYCSQAKIIATEIHSARCLIPVYKNLSEIYLALNRTEESIFIAKEALVMVTEAGNKFEEVLIRRTLGKACFVQNDYHHAQDYFTTALDISQRIQTRNQSSILYNDLAMVYVNQDKLPKAKIHAQIALSEAKAINASKLIEEALSTLELLDSNTAQQHVM